jgi:hypothetical protein
MGKTIHVPVKKSRARTPSSARPAAAKPAPEAPARDLRAPVQILRSTKEWLDQIIAERDLRSYDEAIMFLVAERQRTMPSDFGVFSEIEPYTCSGED